MGCNGRIFERLQTPPWLRLPCKSGLQWEDFWVITPLTKIAIQEWAAMGGILRNYPTPWLKLPSKSGLQWAVMGNFWGITPWLKLPCKSGLQCVAMGGFLSDYEPQPDWDCHVRVGCKGLQWEDSWAITNPSPPPWLKLPCKSGLQSAEMGGFLSNYHPRWLRLPCKRGLQWASMGGILMNYPLTKVTM